MSVNKVILLGNLGKDPEVRYTPQQTAIGTFSIATTERRKDSSGNWTDHTEWHNIVCFGKTAENCQKYLKKGRQVFIEGRLQTRKWQDKEGNNRYTTEIVAGDVRFVGGSRGEAASSSGGDFAESAPADNGGSMPPAGAPPAVNFEDDDIPF